MIKSPSPYADLYPPPGSVSTPPAWEDIERLALHYPAAYHAVTMVRRGDWTREQALVALVYALADSFQKLFRAEIDRHVRDFQASARLPGVDKIRIPGAQREKRRQQKLQSGLALKPALIKQLDDVAKQLGLKALSARL